MKKVKVVNFKDVVIRPANNGVVLLVGVQQGYEVNVTNQFVFNSLSDMNEFLSNHIQGKESD